MNPPKPNAPDADNELQEALTPYVDAMISTAKHVGWHEQDIAGALLQIAVANVLALDANKTTEAVIKEAVERVYNVAN